MRLVPVKDFCNQHDLTMNTVYVTKKHNKKAHYIVEKDGEVFLNEKFLTERADLLQRLWVLSHDYYYYFTYVVGITQNRLAHILEEKVGGTYLSWGTYLSNIFKRRTKSIMCVQLPELTLKFIEFSEYIIPKAHMLRKKDEAYLNRLKDMI